MKVFYLSESFCTHDSRFIKAIMAQGHEVSYASIKANSGFSPELLSYSQFSLHQGPWQKLDGHSVDVAHIGPINEETLDFVQKCSVPKVMVSWGSDVLVGLDNSKLETSFILNGLKCSKAFLTDCNLVTEKLESYIGKNVRPIYQFPWGIEVERFMDHDIQVKATQIRKSLGWKDFPVFISCRRWEHSYGIEELIEAFRLLLKTEPKAKLILASSGSMRPYIIKLIDTHKLRNSIFLPGFIDEENLPYWLSAADIYISASKSDGSSISLLEAMMCQKPVIVHNQFGNLEWVEDGVNGWLVDCTSSTHMAEGMKLALSQHKKWEKMGDTNRKVVLDRASWSKNSKILSTVYNRVVGESL